MPTERSNRRVPHQVHTRAFPAFISRKEGTQLQPTTHSINLYSPHWINSSEYFSHALPSLRDTARMLIIEWSISICNDCWRNRLNLEFATWKYGMFVLILVLLTWHTAMGGWMKGGGLVVVQYSALTHYIHPMSEHLSLHALVPTVSSIKALIGLPFIFHSTDLLTYHTSRAICASSSIDFHFCTL